MSSQQAVAAGPEDNGHAITLAVGERVTVTLQSTFWQFAQPAGTILRVGTAAHPQPASSCIPGGGCGTVSATFIASQQGATDITATRSSCGEAMGCIGKTGQFVLHVVVH